MARSAPGPIAIVAPGHPAITRGGAEIAAYALYEGLKQIGQEAIFIATCPEAARDRFHATSRDEFPLITDPAHYDDFYTLSAAGTARQLTEILGARRARSVNFHHHINVGLNSFRTVADSTKIPFFVTFHDFTAICAHRGQMVTRPAGRLCEQASPAACAACFPERPPQQFAVRERFMRAALLAARGYISPSRFVAERYIAWGLPRAKFSVIENGLRVLPARKAPPLSHARERPFVFGTFGRVNRSKGIDTVLDAFDLIADQPALARRIEIRIHGSLGDDMARFHAAIAAHDFASYAGAYENADVFALMAKCDYVLVPSTWWENSPVIIQEAYAAGRPVICTGIGGMAEKVPAGPHFDRDDPADLVRALTEAANARVHKTLTAALPSPVNSAGMAEAYLAAFKAN